MIRKYFYVRHILSEPFLDRGNGREDSQNNGHSWSLDDVITDTNHILTSHSLCFCVALRSTHVSRATKKSKLKELIYG